MAFRAHGITGNCKPATKEGKKILRTILVKKQHPLADKKGRQQQQQQQHFDKPPEKFQVAEKDAQHAQVIAKLCAAQKRKYQPWHLANAEMQPSAIEVAVAGEANDDLEAEDQQEPSEEEFEDVFGHQHQDDKPPCGGSASSSGPYVPCEMSVTDTQRLSISENKAKALAMQALRRTEGKVSSAQRTVISDNKAKAVAKKRARASQPVWNILEDTDFYSVPTAGSTILETFPQDLRVNKELPPAPATSPDASVLACRNWPRTYELGSTELPPAFPVFIAETVQPPVTVTVQSPFLSEEDVLPAGLNVEEELAELNGGGVRQSHAESSFPENSEVGSSCAVFCFPEEPPGDFDLIALSELLDLHNDRVVVSWPRGLDAVTVSALLKRAVGPALS
jgi:hypothetical protein